jgi:hypothetical protein
MQPPHVVHSPESLRRALEARGVSQIRRVRFKANRVRLLSISRDRATLNLHECFREAGPAVLDAIAVFVRSGRRSAAFRDAVRRLRSFAAPRLAAAARDGGGVDGGAEARPPRPGRCCGTPAQRAFLAALYAELNRSRCGGRLPATVPLRFSDRMRRRLGHVRYHVNPAGERVVVELALNIDLLLDGSEAQLVDTLLHEMAHVAAWLEHGHRGHGATWRRIAERFGCEPRACTRVPIRRRARGRAPTSRVPVLSP